jgi:hypothetical protein
MRRGTVLSRATTLYAADRRSWTAVGAFPAGRGMTRIRVCWLGPWSWASKDSAFSPTGEKRENTRTTRIRCLCQLA